MIKNYFCKENAFNSIVFLSILIMTIIKSFIAKEELLQISSILALPIFVLSTIDIVVSALERINDSQTQSMLFQIEYCLSNYEIDLYEIENINIHNFNTIFENMFSDDDNPEDHNIEWIKNEVTNYRFTYESRKVIRTIRKVFLSLFYLDIIVILVFLFTASNVMPMIDDLNFNTLTIWSFIIILFEILLKEPLIKMSYSFIDKKTKKYIEKNNL